MSFQDVLDDLDVPYRESTGVHGLLIQLFSTLLCTCITMQINSYVNSLSWSSMDLWDSLGTSTIQWDMKCRERSDRDLTGGSLQTI